MRVCNRLKNINSVSGKSSEGHHDPSETVATVGFREAQNSRLIAWLDSHLRAPASPWGRKGQCGDSGGQYSGPDDGRSGTQERRAAKHARAHGCFSVASCGI
jgi:hypothetical protein